MSQGPHEGSSSPSLEAVRALEQRLAERADRREASARLVEAAAVEAERIRAAGRARGQEAAVEERRRVLAEAEAEAARIRDGAERRASALTAALAARLERTVDELERLVLPDLEERP